LRRNVLLGHMVHDWAGKELGRIVDTWPFDGGGEPELAVVRVGRLGSRRMVPVDALLNLGDGLRLPYARWQVEDSPPFGESRYTMDDDPHCALSYWRWEEPVDSLTARCLLSSGSSATVRRFPMTPSRTTIAS
jgi:hypothetical protein